jgi:hypothetical protein
MKKVQCDFLQMNEKRVKRSDHTKEKSRLFLKIIHKVAKVLLFFVIKVNGNLNKKTLSTSCERHLIDKRYFNKQLKFLIFSYLMNKDQACPYSKGLM